MYKKFNYLLNQSPKIRGGQRYEGKLPEMSVTKTPITIKSFFSKCFKNL